MNLYKVFKEELFLVILSTLFLFGDTSQILAGKDKVVAFIDLTEEEPEGNLSSKKKVRVDGSRAEELDDDVFLAAVEQTEKGFLLKQSQSTVLFKRARLPGPESTPSPDDDAIFSSPAVLKWVDKAEAVYALEMKKSSSHEKASGEISSKLLTTFQQHQDHLFTSIEKARRSILITSHSFSATLRSHGRLFEALHKSSLRGVKIYLYFNKDSGLADEEVRFLEATGIKLSNPLIHSKLLIVDKSLVTCGSFDWLSNPFRMQENIESSVVLEGKDLNLFIEEIWTILKQYKQVSLNPSALRSVERGFDQLSSLVFETDSKIEEYELLITPQQHGNFFADCLETGQHQISLCAPFITKDMEFLSSILPKPILARFLKTNRILQIFYRSNDENFALLSQYLREFICPNLMLIPVGGLHRKTLIMDGKYVEGSFNWLSSARTLEDDFFLMETSFVFTGPKAIAFSEEFYHSMKSSQ